MIFANHAINSGSQKRSSFVAPLLAAGYGERCWSPLAKLNKK
jgi:hypothetical protein